MEKNPSALHPDVASGQTEEGIKGDEKQGSAPMYTADEKKLISKLPLDTAQWKDDPSATEVLQSLLTNGRCMVSIELKFQRMKSEKRDSATKQHKLYTAEETEMVSKLHFSTRAWKNDPSVVNIL